MFFKAMKELEFKQYRSHWNLRFHFHVKHLVLRSTEVPPLPPSWFLSHNAFPLRQITSRRIGGNIEFFTGISLFPVISACKYG